MDDMPIPLKVATVTILLLFGFAIGLMVGCIIDDPPPSLCRHCLSDCTSNLRDRDEALAVCIDYCKTAKCSGSDETPEGGK
jgi:hypothetical protein